jgi:hypothetical protein
MIKFKITNDDGDVTELTGTARDVLTWERTTRGAKFGDLADGMTFGALYKIAWLAAKRTHFFDGALAEWEESYDVEPANDDDEDESQDPT